MRNTLGRHVCFCVGLAVTMLASSHVQSAPPENWTKIPVKTITLFYPGQASNAWTRSSKHMGFDWVRRGARCRTCHEGEEEAMGKLLVSGGKLEPAPIAGKSGFKKVSVQTAYDSENLYFRFQWRSDMSREGRMHNMVRFTSLVFDILEPFAKQLWRHEVSDFADRSWAFSWKKDTYFGNLFQRVVAVRPEKFQA